jgi:hypothetical protein
MTDLEVVLDTIKQAKFLISNYFAQGGLNGVGIGGSQQTLDALIAMLNDNEALDRAMERLKAGGKDEST